MRDVLDQPTEPRLDPWRSVVDWRAKGFPALDAPIARMAGVELLF